MRWWSARSLRTRLARTLVGLGLISVVLLASVNYVVVRELLSHNTEIQLETLREVRADSIEVSIDRLLTRTSAIGSDRAVAAALSELEAAYEEIHDDITEAQRFELVEEYYPVVEPYDAAEVDRPTINELIPNEIAGRYLQYHYIAAQPEDERAGVVDAGDGSAYSAVHAVHHQFLADLAASMGATDLLLIGDGTRDVVYSVSKRVDLGTDAFEGPHRDAGLGVALGKLAGVAVDESVLTDTRFYLPDTSAPVVHVATAVRLGSDVVGALVLRVPVEGMTAIVTAGQDWDLLGLGETGDAYLLGADRSLRTVPRPWFEDFEDYLGRFVDRTGDERSAELMRFTGSPVLIQAVENRVIDAALEGDVAIGRVDNLLGRPALASAQPIDAGGLGWIVVTEQQVRESDEELGRFLWSIVILLAILLSALAVTGAILARRLARPLRPLVDAAAGVAAGDHEVPLPELGNNELGDVARQLQSVTDRMREQEASIQAEEARIATMLENVVPPSLAQRVRRGEADVAEAVEEATVIVITVRGIPTASTTEQDTLIELTGQLRSGLMGLAREHGVDRVKITLERQLFVSGGGVAGISANEAVSFAQAAVLALPDLGREQGLEIEACAGLSAGLVGAGVLGTNQSTFDIWGSPVERAQALVAQAPPGSVLMDASVVGELAAELEAEPVDGAEGTFRLVSAAIQT